VLKKGKSIKKALANACNRDIIRLVETFQRIFLVEEMEDIE
jgi:hypothetical protein